MYIIRCDYNKLHQNYKETNFCDRRIVYKEKDGKINVLGFIARNRDLNPTQRKERKDKLKEFIEILENDDNDGKKCIEDYFQENYGESNILFAMIPGSRTCNIEELSLSI